MSTRAVSKYLELVSELRLARLEHELRREPFPQSTEVEYVAALDRWWRDMTDIEQEEIERRLWDDVVEAPADIGDRDVCMKLGAANMPRRKAA